MVKVSGSGVEAAPSGTEQSPDTYVGFQLAERFSSPERVARDKVRIYSPPETPSLNQWGFSGARSGVLQAAPGKIVFRFHSRDLHLVLGPAQNRELVRFRVKLDGATPGDDCEADCTPDGIGQVRKYRLYQLIRQKGPVRDRIFEIEFLDPCFQAFVFTFG